MQPNSPPLLYCRERAVVMQGVPVPLLIGTLSAMAAASRAELKLWLLPLIVTVMDIVCGPVPNGGEMPVSATVITH